MVKAERLDLDQSTFRKSVKRMLFVITITEIITYILWITIGEWWFEHVFHKLGSEMIFMTFNCSLCFAFSQYLKKDRGTTLKIWYASLTLTILWQISWWTFKLKLGKLGFAANASISCYLIYLLNEIMTLSDLYPVVVIKLFNLEIVLFIINISLYIHTVITIYTNKHSQLWRTLYSANYTLALLKMYIVISEWKTDSNSKPSSPKRNNQYDYQLVKVQKIPSSNSESSSSLID